MRFERNMEMSINDNLGGIPPLSLWERRLAALYLGNPVAAGDMELLTGHLDIDQCSQTDLLMLSCIGYRHGWEGFPEKIIPRLKGLHQYHQVHNTIRLPWLLKKIHALRQANIPVMLLKGLALRFYYAPGLPRVMGDYDIAVPESLYDEAIHILQTDGDTYLGNAPWLYHGQIRGKDRCLEVHSWIFKHHGEKDTDIWDRAVPCDFFGKDVLVPCPEDMLLHQMDNRSRDMFENIFPGRTSVFLCDCCRIVDRMPGFDPDRLAERARELHVTNSARRMLLFLTDFLPDRFSVEEIERAFPRTAEYDCWLEAGRKLRRATMRWQSWHYREGGSMTPLRLVRMVPRHYALSRMRAAELSEMGVRYNFWIYCRDLWKAGGCRMLLRRVENRPEFEKHSMEVGT